MNLKRRLIITNAAAVMIPVVVTAMLALVFIFAYSRIWGGKMSFDNYQKLAQIKLELISGDKNNLAIHPEQIEDSTFQNYMKSRLEGINGEIIITKDEKVLYASAKFNSIDLEKLLAAGKDSDFNNTVKVGRMTYAVEDFALNLKNGEHRGVIIMAPVDRNMNIMAFMIGVGVCFVVIAAFTNVLASYYLTRRMLFPLNNLRKAAGKISKGDLDHPIIEEGDGEIAELCRDLDLMRIKLKDLIHAQLKYEENRKMLVSSISHDLKTPVTSIKGYVEGIRDRVADTPEKVDRYLQTIYQKTEQIDKMIDDLLLYAKLDLNQIPFNFVPVLIKAYLEDFLLANEYDLERSKIVLDFKSQLENDHEVLVDRERMDRVLMNILENSRKYMNKEQGKIAVRLRETQFSIIIELRDNGAGIAEEDLPYIFDRFYRSDEARTEIKGSGLGLAIARQIVEGHGGRIWAVSHGNDGVSIMISLSKVF